MIWFILWWIVGVLSVSLGDYLDSKRNNTDLVIIFKVVIENLFIGIWGLIVTIAVICIFIPWKKILDKEIITIDIKKD